jgi:signal transduction histidine kinase
MSSDGIERIAPARDYPVLYVDDEPENLLVFSAVLGDEFTILTAGSAEEALHLLAQRPVNVLVADQRMPHVSGIELCHLVWERLPHVRRMLLTAFSDHQTAIEAINRGGVHAYIEKPWDPLTIRRALWEAVNRVHLDRTVVDLRGALAERDVRLEHARARERLLHDVANATSRLTLSTRMFQKILDRFGNQLPPEVRDALTKEVAALSKATEHLLSLQSERARSPTANEFRVEALRLPELFRTVSALAAFPPDGSLALRMDAVPDVEVRADRLAVTRILVNLVQNARQAIEGSGRHEGEVRVEAHPGEGPVIEIDVADSGPGVAPELRERVFDEHFTTRGTSGGTGLGLATARDLARATGGALELPSEQPERGALFRLRLPAAEGGSPTLH